MLLSFLLFDSIFFPDCQSDNEVSSPQQLFSLMYVMYDNIRGDDGNLAENFTFCVSFISSGPNKELDQCKILF